MNNIKWEDEAVCFAAKKQWNSILQHDVIIDLADFQLNEIRQGDYIPASELDTEQKYNNAVDVFGMFGFKVCDKANDFNWFASGSAFKIESLVLTERNVMGSKYVGSVFQHNRKLTYQQLMSIGKLKRMMLSREKSAPKTTPDFTSDVERKTATNYLQECMEVQKERGEQYNSKGTGERSFAAIAKAFTAITGKKLVGSDIALIQQILKDVRQYADPTRFHEDSGLDKVSYASLHAEELRKELL